jgi:hypothetical protein
VQQGMPLFDDCIGTCRETRWYFEPKCLGGLEVDHKLESGSLINWQIGRLLALKDASDIEAGSPLTVCNIRSIAHQTASDRGCAGFICRRDRDLRSERDQEIAPAV